MSSFSSLRNIMAISLFAANTVWATTIKKTDETPQKGKPVKKGFKFFETEHNNEGKHNMIADAITNERVLGKATAITGLAALIAGAATATSKMREDKNDNEAAPDIVSYNPEKMKADEAFDNIIQGNHSDLGIAPPTGDIDGTIVYNYEGAAGNEEAHQEAMRGAKAVQAVMEDAGLDYELKNLADLGEFDTSFFTDQTDFAILREVDVTSHGVNFVMFAAICIPMLFLTWLFFTYSQGVNEHVKFMSGVTMVSLLLAGSFSGCTVGALHLMSGGANSGAIAGCAAGAVLSLLLLCFLYSKINNRYFCFSDSLKHVSGAATLVASAMIFTNVVGQSLAENALEGGMQKIFDPDTTELVFDNSIQSHGLLACFLLGCGLFWMLRLLFDNKGGELKGLQNVSQVVLAGSCCLLTAGAFTGGMEFIAKENVGGAVGCIGLSVVLMGLIAWLFSNGYFAKVAQRCGSPRPANK